jgi:hypothetical protein
MSVVLDAYAVIAALVGERARAEVEPLLSSGVVCAPNLTKVLDVCVRVHGNDEVTVRERIGWLLTGGLQVTALDTSIVPLDPGPAAGQDHSGSRGDPAAHTRTSTSGMKRSPLGRRAHER